MADRIVDLLAKAGESTKWRQGVLQSNVDNLEWTPKLRLANKAQISGNGESLNSRVNFRRDRPITHNRVGCGGSNQDLCDRGMWQ